ncbi:hypothetical protein CH373_05910 [Leptospira perolatii]|uniref:DUF309 domain-containing protein n=1 Tax=Leptospira perolatii TaxID=2023191 RepID=A0A2M9ZQS2_9LEPT|nr:DUF309 domain-containing protein [Leptospira perolatii]PJZ68374.1 hypothetical protein CH360_16495 [Leptospira perolatii]PJZ74430.1 hypothetical protein CH373_05910 [Leptospira perolatii]
MEFDDEIRGILSKISSTKDPIPTFDFAWDQGRKLFAEGRYFEVHEVFEFQWKKETGSRRILLHGWIQLAISLNKIYVKHNARGARMQAEKSKEKFEKLLLEGNLNSTGVHYTNHVLDFINRILQHFQGDENWDYSSLIKIPIPQIPQTGVEWFIREGM